MSDYDFSTLNDKEFEVFCVDLLSDVEGKIFERFKPGKDSGVDGRFFSSDGGEVVLQCKHWVATPVKQLIKDLEKKEKPKLDKLRPARYIVAISNQLSRTDKKAIYSSLQPHIKSESDIFGREDLNDHLSKRPLIEQRHYKLWLKSSSVMLRIMNSAILGRSEFSLQEIYQKASLYVFTANHNAALAQLEKLGVVIITGEPGIGKSTLAEHLCLHYVAEGFQYIKLAGEVPEAESIFNTDVRQVFYFDDFLGRNYLDAILGDEGANISQFIRRVAANKNKRFILTSRSNVLNQGKMFYDSLENNNIQRNEYEIKIASLTELDKAHILYSHIWHSNLGVEFIDQLYVGKRYREIIRHKNFNPRLISFITDHTRLETDSAGDYWLYVVRSLSNPKQIWEHAFVAQDDFSRVLIFLVVISRRRIAENELSDAYRRYISMPEHKVFSGRHEFQSNIRLLTGAFLNRNITTSGPATYDLFNPSVGDFVIGRFGKDITALRHAVYSLRTSASLVTLMGLEKEQLLSESDVVKICSSVLEALITDQFSSSDVTFVAFLCEMIIKRGGGSSVEQITALNTATKFIWSDAKDVLTSDMLVMMERGLSMCVISDKEAIQFLERFINLIDDDKLILAATSLLSKIPDECESKGHVSSLLQAHVFDLLNDDLDSFIETTDVFGEVEYRDYDNATAWLEEMVSDKLTSLGISHQRYDVSEIVDSYGVVEAMDRFQRNSRDDDDYERPNTAAFDSPDQAIDDLFDRGS